MASKFIPEVRGPRTVSRTSEINFLMNNAGLLNDLEYSRHGGQNYQPMDNNINSQFLESDK